MRHRKQIYYYDLARIERATDPLSPAEQDVRERLTHEGEEQLVTRLDLATALKVLTEKQQACFLLFADGHTYRDIARALSLSLPTVQQHVTAARRKLKKILGDTIQTP